MRTLGLLFSLLLTMSAPVFASEFRVLASITPVQLIASEVLDGITVPDKLLPPGASPHQYSLKPSDVRRIQQADLVLWVGPQLERFLVKSLQQTDAKVLTLLDEEHEGEVEESSHEGHDHHDGHDHGGVDPHVWLEPFYVLEVASMVRDAAAALKPEYKAQLDANYQRFASRLIGLDKTLMARFMPLSERGFIVFHDAYGRFVEHYQLLQLDAITINPSRKPGAKHLSELRQRVIDSQAVCVFSEPQFSSSVLDAVTAGSEVKIVELDPLGQDIEPQAGAYTVFLQRFADTVHSCLVP